MNNLGFHPKFCAWIRECISTVSYSVMVNGVPSDHFRPERGLRQGDPLPPFLFLLCVEDLSAYIQKIEMDGMISGVWVAPGAAAITHLFFVDDSEVFCKVDETEVGNIIKILEDYGRVSGQIINLEKSFIFFGNGCLKKNKKWIVSRMNI